VWAGGHGEAATAESAARAVAALRALPPTRCLTPAWLAVLASAALAHDTATVHEALAAMGAQATHTEAAGWLVRCGASAAAAAAQATLAACTQQLGAGGSGVRAMARAVHLHPAADAPGAHVRAALGAEALAASPAKATAVLGVVPPLPQHLWRVRSGAAAAATRMAAAATTATAEVEAEEAQQRETDTDGRGRKSLLPPGRCASRVSAAALRLEALKWVHACPSSASARTAAARLATKRWDVAPPTDDGAAKAAGAMACSALRLQGAWERMRRLRGLADTGVLVSNRV